DRDVLGDASRDVERRSARLDRRVDVEEHELVGARVRVRRAELDGIADVAELRKADALDDAAVSHVEARDQTRERHRSRKREPAAPLFSGWNWTPRNDSYSATATTPSLVARGTGRRRAGAMRARPSERYRRRTRRSRPSQHALRARELRALTPDGLAQRASDRLARRFGDVMGIAARRLDVQRHTCGLGEALERVPGKPGILLERDLRAAP